MTESSENLSGGVPFKEKIETGIMLEVPSVALLADKFAEEVDFSVLAQMISSSTSWLPTGATPESGILISL